MFATKAPSRKVKSSIQLSRETLNLCMFSIPVKDYLSNIDSALLPMDNIDEIERNFSNQPQEYNDNIIIYSNRTESSLYDPALNKFLKTNENL